MSQFPVRPQKRGPWAWVNACLRVMIGSTREGRNPLLVHAVQDDSNEKQYLPATGKYIDWCAENGIPVNNVEQRDEAMADFFAKLCYATLCFRERASKPTICGHQELPELHPGV